MNRNDVKRMLSQVDEKYIAELTAETEKKPLHRRWYGAVAAAAMIMLCVGIGYSLLSDIQRAPMPQSSVEQSRPAESENELTDREITAILNQAKEQSFSIGDEFVFPDTCLAYTTEEKPELPYLPFSDVAVYYSAGEFNTGETIDRARFKALDRERSLTLTVYAAADPDREDYLKLTDGIYLCMSKFQSQIDTLYAFGDSISCEIRTTGLTEREILQIAVNVLQDATIAQMPDKKALVRQIVSFAGTLTPDEANTLPFCKGYVLQAVSIDGMSLQTCQLYDDETLVQTWESTDRTLVAYYGPKDPELPVLSVWEEAFAEPFSDWNDDNGYYYVHFQIPIGDGYYICFYGELTEEGLWEVGNARAEAQPELTLQEANEIPCFQGCVPQWGEPSAIWRETVPAPESDNGIYEFLHVNYTSDDCNIGVMFTTRPVEDIGSAHLLPPEEWDAVLAGDAPYIVEDEESAMFSSDFVIDAGEFRVQVTASGTDPKQLLDYAEELFSLPEIYN